MHGLGRIIEADGSIYEGEWTDGLKNGSGVYTFTDDSRYEGQWKNDKQHGKGTLIQRVGWSTFSKMTGVWEDGICDNLVDDDCF